MATTLVWGGNTLDFEDSNHITDDLKISSGPGRTVNSVKIARASGDFVIDISSNSRTIHLSGTLSFSTQALLEAGIDTDKKLLAGDPLNRGFGIFTFSWNGASRECDVICPDLSQLFEQRTGRDITKCPFEIDLLIPSGEVRATTYTTESGTSVTTGYTTATVTVSSATMPVRPQYTVTFTDATPTSGTPLTMILTNTTTTQGITLAPTAFSNTDVFRIDTESKIVRQNQNVIDYSGVFPELVPGANALVLDITKASTIVNSFTGVLNPVRYYGATHSASRKAQSFVAGATTSIKNIWLYMYKSRQYISGTFGDLAVRIETDTAGAPSGTLVTNGSLTIATALIPQTSPGWVQAAFSTAPSLTSGTTYWIVLSAASTTHPNEYAWVEGSGSASAKTSLDGSTWAYTNTGLVANYKLIESGGIAAIAATLDIKYRPLYL